MVKYTCTHTCVQCAILSWKCVSFNTKTSRNTTNRIKLKITTNISRCSFICMQCTENVNEIKETNRPKHNSTKYGMQKHHHLLEIFGQFRSSLYVNYYTIATSMKLVTRERRPLFWLIFYSQDIIHIHIQSFQIIMSYY